MEREQLIAKLSEPLDDSVVKTRDQSGVRLSYVEGWYVIDQANQCFGFDGWSSETLDVREVQAEFKKNANGKEQWYVGYTARVRLTVLGIVRDGCGFGSGIDKDLGRAHESAIKEAETDALKRAFRSFGYRFGLALYDKDKAHVGNGKAKKAASLNGESKKTADVKAREVWQKLGCVPGDFDAYVSEHGKKLSYGAIAKAYEQGITVDQALRELQNA